MGIDLRQANTTTGQHLETLNGQAPQSFAYLMKISVWFSTGQTQAESGVERDYQARSLHHHPQPPFSGYGLSLATTSYQEPWTP